jgi:hypothetical protein
MLDCRFQPVGLTRVSHRNFAVKEFPSIVGGSQLLTDILSDRPESSPHNFVCLGVFQPHWVAGEKNGLIDALNVCLIDGSQEKSAIFFMLTQAAMFFNSGIRFIAGCAKNGKTLQKQVGALFTPKAI